MKITAFSIYLLFLMLVIAGCATSRKPPPTISLDEPVQAQPLPEPPKPIAVVEVPKPLPLPDQLKPAPAASDAPASTPAPPAGRASPQERVEQANAEARVTPTPEGYVNAIQVWPYSDGALYQVYTSPGRVTVIALQAGEDLVTVAAGDTVRWIVGDTTSGNGDQPSRERDGQADAQRPQDKPRHHHQSPHLPGRTRLHAKRLGWPRYHGTTRKDELLALQAQAQAADAAAPVATGVSLDNLRFRYAITGANPPWKPLRAFDDGQRVYIQFPAGIAQGELPPLFVIGPQGDGQLVNYRFHAPYYIVDRLFGAAELRLGGDKAVVVRIERTDGIAARSGS